MELVDTTVWVYRRHPKVEPWFDQQILTRQLATCHQVYLELLYAVRNGSEFQVLRSSLTALPSYPIREREWERAMEIYEQLSAVRPMWHRSVRHADLLIAACAEANNLTLVHYDPAFEAIAQITRQPMRWISGEGSL